MAQVVPVSVVVGDAHGRVAADGAPHSFARVGSTQGFSAAREDDGAACAGIVRRLAGEPTTAEGATDRGKAHAHDDGSFTHSRSPAVPRRSLQKTQGTRPHSEDCSGRSTREARKAVSSAGVAAGEGDGYLGSTPSACSPQATGRRYRPTDWWWCRGRRIWGPVGSTSTSPLQYCRRRAAGGPWRRLRASKSDPTLTASRRSASTPIVLVPASPAVQLVDASVTHVAAHQVVEVLLTDRSSVASKSHSGAASNLVRCRWCTSIPREADRRRRAEGSTIISSHLTAVIRSTRAHTVVEASRDPFASCRASMAVRTSWDYSLVESAQVVQVVDAVVDVKDTVVSL